MILNISDGRITNNIGNKAKFLMLMSKDGFAVPNGIILSSEVFNKIIDDNNKRVEILELLERLNHDNLEEISNKLINIISTLTIPTKIINTIKKMIKQDKKYAVRSSGIKEDLQGYSFAGQYESFLNIDKFSEILNSIINCYKSMYSITVLSYLINQNIDTSNLEMAVIIQEMVAADKSGVIFTINPITGNDKEIVIEIAKGLGENIVNGKVVPERYTYDWFNNKSSYDKNNILLTKEQLYELKDIALRLQIYFGYPCDIEFAYENKKLFILQTRAITKVMYSKIEDEWSTANFKDGGISSSVAYPFMWSLYEYIWENKLKDFIVDSKLLKAPEIHKLGNMYYGRPYWNISMVKKALKKVPGYKERDFDEDIGVGITYQGDGDTTKITLKSLFNIIIIAFQQQKILKKQSDNTPIYHQEFLDKYEAYLNNYNKSYLLEEFEQVWYQLIKKDYFKIEGTYFLQIFINTVHLALYKDKLLKYINEQDYMNLLGGLKDISHLRPIYDLWHISRKIIADYDSFDFWHNNSVDQINKAYDQDPTQYFMPNIAHHISQYGYHSNKELDVTYPCFFEDINSVIKRLKDMILLTDDSNPLNQQDKQYNIYLNQLSIIKNNTSLKKYESLSKTIGRFRKLLWWREEFKDTSTRFYYIIRIYTLKLAKRYVENGVITNIEDIWFLKMNDICDYIDKKKTDIQIKEIIKKNKDYYNSFKNFHNESEIGVKFNQQSTNKKSGINDLIGIGCNSGEVTGVARVIDSIDEIDKLQENDILVTKYTDTGWTSKFSILKGIISENGGMLCHSAIVAREYGIPCIVAVSNARKVIKDGSIISINGNTGEIVIIKEK